jgi:hypothetical protein
MPRIAFPDIPKFPGVPALPRTGAALPGLIRISVGILQNKLLTSVIQGGQWGIFDKSGKQLGNFQDANSKFLQAINYVGLGNAYSTGGVYSTGSVEYSKEMKVSDYPLEKGSFANYNKVEQPSTPSVTLCFSGSESERTKFLEAIDKATKSTDLYSVVTPEVTYINYSLEHYNYQRTSTKGATLLIVEIGLKEIRQVSAVYAKTEKPPITSPKNPNSKTMQDNGKTQARAPDVSTLKKLGDAFPNFAAKTGEFLTGLIK